MNDTYTYHLQKAADYIAGEMVAAGLDPEPMYRYLEMCLETGERPTRQGLGHAIEKGAIDGG